MKPPFEVLGEASLRVPLLAHVPHSGTNIPPTVASDLLLSGEALEAEVIRTSDLLTDELFSSVVDLGGCMFVNRLSRLAFDPERFRDDDVEPMAAKGVGAVYLLASDGARLRTDDVFESQREQILTTLYDPYAAAISDLCDRLLQRFGRCLVVDCHSFPLIPLAWEPHPTASRPPICIGADAVHTPDLLVADMVRACSDAGVAALVNEPFKGSYVPSRHYGSDRRVASVMIEVRRDLYLDEASGRPADSFDTAKSFVTLLLSVAAEWAGF